MSEKDTMARSVNRRDLMEGLAGKEEEHGSEDLKTTRGHERVSSIHQHLRGHTME